VQSSVDRERDRDGYFVLSGDHCDRLSGDYAR
jgi:hypothetical protein